MQPRLDASGALHHITHWVFLIYGRWQRGLLGERGEGREESESSSGIRKRKEERARRPFRQLVIKRISFHAAEVVHFVGVTTSSINRLGVSAETSDLSKYLTLFQNLCPLF